MLDADPYPSVKARDLKVGHTLVGTDGGLLRIDGPAQLARGEGSMGDPLVLVGSEWGWLMLDPNEEVDVEKADV